MPTTYAIPNGRTVFGATSYTGNGGTQTISTPTGFKPDYVWLKDATTGGRDPRNLDTVRGATNTLYSSLTNPQTVESTGLTAFTSTGFTLGSQNAYNGSGDNYIAWNWQAGQGTTSTNNNGSVTSTVSVNQTAGFSIVTFTTANSGSSMTFGHGLGAVPQFMMLKPTGISTNWACYHVGIGNTANIFLNATNTQNVTTGAWNNTSPDANVATLGSAYIGSLPMVGYCWAPVAGYSSFGTYVGNGSSDGPFVYTGFRPAFVMTKGIDTAVTSWWMIDNAQNPYNQDNNYLFADTSASQQTTGWGDFLSNGFKIRTNYGGTNNSGEKYIYIAFAENPFKYANAR